MGRIMVAAVILGLLLLMHGLSCAVAASGGRMGGSFFSSEESPPSVSSPPSSNFVPSAKTDDSVPSDYVPPPPAKTYNSVDQSYEYKPSAPPEHYISDPPAKTYNYVPPPAKADNSVRRSYDYNKPSATHYSKPYNSAPPNHVPAAKTYYSSVHHTYNYYPSQPYCSANTYNSARRNNVAPPAETKNSSSDANNVKYDAANALVSLFCVCLGFICVLAVVLIARSEIAVLAAADRSKTTVLKLQVGLLDSRKSVQKEFNGIAEMADTSTPNGLRYILTETVVALLRHINCCVFAYSSADVKRSKEVAERIFNQLSVEERSKFDKETLVNVNNIKKCQRSTLLRECRFGYEYENTGTEEERPKFDEETLFNVDKQSSKASGYSNEYIVITILVAVRGAHKLRSINNIKDLKEALENLASVPSTRTVAVEVLWTPQDEDESLMELELHQDYPLLRPLKDSI